jgi:hypothetical protein
MKSGTIDFVEQPTRDTFHNEKVTETKTTTASEYGKVERESLSKGVERMKTVPPSSSSRDSANRILRFWMMVRIYFLLCIIASTTFCKVLLSAKDHHP